MKTHLTWLIAALLFGVLAPVTQAREAVSVDFFYDNLEPHGDWREVGDYGYCWQPRDVGSDWRPYSDGRWVYTDAGWTWDSNEPFGWAVYHYGRWVDVGNVGWVWVPGTEWGPGWVSWRHSPQYVGWAPLPPEARFLLAIGLNSWVDDYYDIGPSHYRFVDNRNFGSRRLNTVFVDQRQNVSIIHQTTNITNISYINNVIHNGGPVYDQQLRQSREPIQRYRLDRRQDFTGDPRRQSPDHLRSRIDGDSMSVLALPFTGRSAGMPHKLGVKVERAEVNHGWKNTGTADEIASMRQKMKSKEQAPKKLPPRTVFHKVTDDASVRAERRPDDRKNNLKTGADSPKSKGDNKPRIELPKGKGDSKPKVPDMAPKKPEAPRETVKRPERPDKPSPEVKKPAPKAPDKAKRPSMLGMEKRPQIKEAGKTRVPIFKSSKTRPSPDKQKMPEILNPKSPPKMPEKRAPAKSQQKPSKKKADEAKKKVP